MLYIFEFMGFFMFVQISPQKIGSLADLSKVSSYQIRIICISLGKRRRSNAGESLDDNFECFFIDFEMNKS